MPTYCNQHASAEDTIQRFKFYVLKIYAAQIRFNHTYNKVLALPCRKKSTDFCRYIHVGAGAETLPTEYFTKFEVAICKPKAPNVNL